MSLTLNILHCALLAVFLSCCAPHADAEPAVEIGFSRDTATGQEVIQATSTFVQHGPSIRKVLLAINGYTALHPWITGASLVKSSNQDPAEFLLEFKFPWPIGRRWSHIEVQQDGGGAIVWQQLAGNMGANQGKLQFAARGRGLVVEYSAVISLELPDILLRRFKKQFVIEFINAAYAQAAVENPTGLTLATSTPYTRQ